MINPSRGDSALHLNGTRYRLRLTLEAARHIEYMTGMSLPRLVERMQSCGLPEHWWQFILREMIRAGQQRPPASSALPASHQYAEALAANIMHAMMLQHPSEAHGLDDLPWEKWMAIAFTKQSMAPGLFWQTSLREWMLLLAGLKEIQTTQPATNLPTETVIELSSFVDQLRGSMEEAVPAAICLGTSAALKGDGNCCSC